MGWILEICAVNAISRFTMKDHDTAMAAKAAVEAEIGRGSMFRNEASKLCRVASEDGEATFVAHTIGSVRVLNNDLWVALRLEETKQQTEMLRQSDREYIELYLAARGRGGATQE